VGRVSYIAARQGDLTRCLGLQGVPFPNSQVFRRTRTRDTIESDSAHDRLIVKPLRMDASKSARRALARSEKARRR